MWERGGRKRGMGEIDGETDKDRGREGREGERERGERQMDGWTGRQADKETKGGVPCSDFALVI